MDARKELLDGLERYVRGRYREKGKPHRHVRGDDGIWASPDEEGPLIYHIGVASGDGDPSVVSVTASYIVRQSTSSGGNSLDGLDAFWAGVDRYRTATTALVRKGYEPEFRLNVDDFLLSARYEVAVEPRNRLNRTVSTIIRAYEKA